MHLFTQFTPKYVLPLKYIKPKFIYTYFIAYILCWKRLKVKQVLNFYFYALI